MFMVKLLVFFSITMVTLDSVNGQIGIAHIVALLKHISDTSTNTSATLPQLAALLKNQADMQTVSNLLLENNTAAVEKIEATQTQMVNTQNQTANTLIQIEMSQAQVSKTLTEIATTQTQIANTFNQVVNLLERQGQQLQNITLTLNSVVSVLENQQEILEHMNRSLPLVLNHQEGQIELVDFSQSTNESCNQNLFSTGRYTINPSNCPISFDVRCDMDTDGGNWTIFQNRFNGSVDFFLGWDEYESGFGSVDGEYWLGLSQIHCMTQSGNWELRIDMEAFDGDTAYAVYDSFSVGDASSYYRLTIGRNSGTAGDSLRHNNNAAFSTKDSDNDNYSRDCANQRKGGWWYNICSESNLNGLYLGPTGTGDDKGNVWNYFKGHQSLKRTEMKMRRVE